VKKNERQQAAVAREMESTHGRTEFIEHKNRRNASVCARNATKLESRRKMGDNQPREIHLAEEDSAFERGWRTGLSVGREIIPRRGPQKIRNNVAGTSAVVIPAI